MNSKGISSVFENVVDNLKWPLVVSDSDGRFIYANRVYLELRALELSFLRGKYWWDVTSESNEGQFERERLNQINRKKKFISIVEYYHQDVGRSTIKWESELVKLSDSRDGNYIIEKGNVIKSESKRFQEINLKQKEFTKILVDKFDSVLNSVTDFGDIVKDYLICDQLKENISKKLENLITAKNDLIDGIKKNNDAITKKMVNLKFIVSEIKQYVIARNDKKISVKIDSDSEQYLVYANYYQLYEALLRLTVIACDLTKANKQINIISSILDQNLEERIDGTLIKPSKYIQIKIEYFRTKEKNTLDDKVFEPFLDSTFKNRGDEKLYEMIFPLIYRTVKIHSGYIFIESTKDNINTFRVLFPAVLKVNDERNNEISEGYVKKIEKYEHSVLIIDYDSTSLNFMESLFRSAGYLVVTANDSEIALEKYFKSEKKPELLIIDPFIPINEGIALIKKLKELNPKIRIVVISNYQKDEIFNQIQNLDS
jgi:CheY-like chemotaxis protein